MFLITVKNLNIILVVYLVKKLIINNVAYTSNGGGVYVQWGWHIRPMDLYVQRAIIIAVRMCRLFSTLDAIDILCLFYSNLCRNELIFKIVNDHLRTFNIISLAQKVE